MGRVLSDAEMSQLESSQPKKALSDDEMAQLEAQHGTGDSSFTPTPREIPEFNAPKELAKATWKTLHQGPRTDAEEEDFRKNTVAGYPPLAIPAAAAPAKLLQLAEFMGATGSRRIAGGAIQGAMSNPEHPIRGAAIGGGMSLAGEVGNKSADWLMRKALGRGVAPGMGNTAVDEGLFGTRDMMRGQVDANKAKAIGQMQEGVVGIQSPISSEPASKNIMDLAEQRSLPVAGNPEPSNASGQVDRILDRAGEAEARGPVHPQNAWQYGKISGKLGYGRTGDPLNSLEAQINQAEQAGYSKALQDASPEFKAGAQKYSTNSKFGDALQSDPMGRNLIDALTGTASVVPSMGAQAVQKGSAPLRDALLRQFILENVKK